MYNGGNSKEGRQVKKAIVIGARLAACLRPLPSRKCASSPHTRRKAYKEHIYERLLSHSVNRGAPEYERIIASQEIEQRFSAFKGTLCGVSSHS